MRVRKAYGVTRPFLIVAAAAALLGGGCALDEVPEDPLFGPSETGVSVQLTALPDTLNADGVSTAQIRLTLRDNSGRGIQGQAVYFTWNGDGELDPSAASRFVGDVQSGFVMATDQNGVVDVVYTAGTALTTITVFVRPYGIDGVNFYERSVDILQR
jgi:hypothetical protein